MKDLTTKRFGKLTVLSLFEIKRYPTQTKSYWNCLCDCGNKKVIRGEHLTANKTISCGCVARDKASKRLTTHGMFGTPEYRAWLFMRNRLKSKEPHKIKSYKGISYDERWDNFTEFLRDMGKKPSHEHSLDRINPFDHYCKYNCRWATRSEQMQNTRRHYP